MPAWLPLLLLLMVVFVCGLFTLPILLRSRSSRPKSYQSQGYDLLPPATAGLPPSPVSGSPWNGRAIIGAEIERQQAPGDLVAQINDLVQEIMAADSTMRGSTIFVGKDTYNGVRITINGQTYSSIDEIPEGTEKNILRAATGAWSARSMGSEYGVQPQPAAARPSAPAPAPTPSPEQPEPVLMPSLTANPTIVLAESANPTALLAEYANADPAPQPHPHACLICGHELPAGSRFCPHCGSSPLQPASATCPHCNEPVESGWQFCNHCGYRLTPS